MKIRHTDTHTTPLQLIVVLGLILFNPLSAFANNAYPKNPCSIEHYLYIGETGLKKFNYKTQSTIWSVLDDTTTFEPVCTDKIILIGSHNGLYAIDSKNGSILWSVAKGSTLYSPAIKNDYVYASDQNGHIRKLDINSGKLIWKKQVKGWLYPPVVINNAVIVGGNGRQLYAFENETGQLLWQRHITQELVYRPITANPDIVIITTYEPRLIVINSKNNKILWSVKTNSAAYTPVVIEQLLFYGDQDGIIHSVDLTTGHQHWQTQLSGVIRSIPAIDTENSNIIWIGTERGQLAALNKNNGTIVWQKQLDEPIVHSPLPLKNKVYFKVDSINLLFEPFSLPELASSENLFTP